MNENILKIMEETIGACSDSGHLHDLMAVQHRTALRFYDKNELSHSQKVEKAVQLATYLQAEVIELLDELDWKAEKKNTTFLKNNLTYEIVDTLKYLLQIADLFDIPSAQISMAFTEKSYVVEKLLDLKKKNQEDKPVVIVDLDGVLANHSKAFLQFVGSQSGIDYSTGDFPSHSLSEFLTGCTLQEYRAMQHDFRKEYNKLMLDPYEGELRSALLSLREKGYRIAIMTARPASQYKHMKYMTMMWLDKNQLPYDLIFWGRDKAELAIKSGCSNIVAAFDNEPSNISIFKHLGINSFLVTSGTSENDFPYQVDFFLRTCHDRK